MWRNAGAVVGLLALLAPVLLGQDRVIGPTFEVNVLDKGAKCDGVTDDSAALQATFTAVDAAGGGTVILPVGTCNFTTPLIIGGSTLHYSMINVFGQSQNTSVLSYTGSATGRAITLSHVAYFYWQDLQVLRSGAKGTTTGVVLSGPFHGNGTQTLTGHFLRTRFQGFHIGVLAGDGSAGEDEASEVLWERCVFSGNDVGWTDSGQNSLNFTLKDVSIGGNQVGVMAGGYGTFGNWTGDGVRIDGADSANNTVADVALGNTFGHTTIRHLRSESSVPMVLGAPDYLTVEDCEGTDNAAGHFAVQVSVGAWVELRRNTFNTPIKLTGNGGEGHVLLEGNLTPAGTAGYPVDFSGLTVANFGTHMRLVDNRQSGPPFFSAFFANREGWFMGGSAGTEWIAEDTDNAALGVGFNRTFTRSLGFGTQTAGKNLRDRITFASAATATYTFVKTPTVAIANSKTISFTAGLITSADIGKRISVANATNLCSAGTGAVVGFIRTTPSTTTATITPTPQNANPTCEGNINLTGSVTATVGENEPDANYFLMVGCDTTGETFKWSAKSTTGFTLTSSNATSTATCDVLVVR